MSANQRIVAAAMDLCTSWSQGTALGLCVDVLSQHEVEELAMLFAVCGDHRTATVIRTEYQMWDDEDGPGMWTYLPPEARNVIDTEYLPVGWGIGPLAPWEPMRRFA